MTALKTSRGFFLLLLACLHLTPVLAADGAAPAFTLKDATGEEVSLADYAGKPLILHFRTLVHGEEVSRAYGVRGTPTTFFVNASGEIVGVTNASKPADPQLLELAEKAVQTAD